MTWQVGRRADIAGFMARYTAAADEVLRPAADEVAAEMRRRIEEQDHVDTGALVGSIGAPERTATDDEITYDVWARAAHAIYVELGRGPGKAPPVSAIQPWVERRLGLAGAEARSAAFAIAKHIGERGIPASYFARSSIQFVDVTQLARDIEARLNRG